MISIRPAAQTDETALGRYGAALMRQHHASDPKRFILTERPEAGYGRFLVAQIGDEDSLVLVAERDGEVVGYLFAAVEGFSWKELRGPGGFVHDVYVDESARGSGVGRDLMQRAIAWMRTRGMKQVVLDSKSKNSIAQGLFASLGFRPTLVEMTLDLDDGAGS